MGKRSAEDELEHAAKKAAKKAKKEKKEKKAKEAAAPAAAAASTEDAEKAAKKAAKKAKKAAKAAKAAAKEASEPAKPKATSGKSKTSDADGDDGKAESSDLPPVMDEFAKAPFAQALIDALSSAFPSPTPIQAQSWPIALNGDDIISVAKTGSGKTLAFLLPAFHVNANASSCAGGPRVLVLAPTRELAVQIEKECDKFGKFAGVTSTCVYGGAPISTQQAALKKGPTIVVATPGRLCDLLDRGDCKLGEAKYVVLDEADRMLDMGFEPQIKQIFEGLPAQRQTLFFTATWPKNVRKLAASFLRGEEHVKRVFIGTSADAELEANTAVSQTFIQARDDEKDLKMYNLLQTLGEGARVVVFANTKRRVDVCARNFAEFGTVAIHGDKQQHERDKALASFIAGDYPLMFATDVAARGLDIKGVTHVMNFDMVSPHPSINHPDRNICP